MTARYVIARYNWSEADRFDLSVAAFTRASDYLPDAEHVHLTRHPDGTWTATPMRQFTKYRQRHERSLIEVMMPSEMWMDGTWLWVDGEAS